MSNVRHRIHETRKERKCRVCGCTDKRACQGPDGPCSWAEQDLCDYCSPLVQALAGWFLLHFGDKPPAPQLVERLITAAKTTQALACVQLACENGSQIQVVSEGEARQYLAARGVGV